MITLLDYHTLHEQLFQRYTKVVLDKNALDYYIWEVEKLY